MLNIPRQRNVATANNEYAVIISGGADSSLNYSRYWNDCSAIYKVLVNYYGYDKNKIFVLMADGPSSCYNTDHPLSPNYSIFPNDLDGDGTDYINYSATSRNVGIVFDSLSHIVTDTDNVFIFVTDHGGEGSTLSMWYGRMTKDQFVAEVNKLSNAKTINICMEQCYSGGYVSALAGERRVIATACAADENSWPRNDGVYDEFCYNWICAVIGIPSSFIYPIADINSDGVVSMKEAFLYATINDHKSETPQYYSNRVCLGEVLTLNGVFNETCLYPDLYIRDSVTDNGTMPSNVAFNWDSSDIWIEDLNGNRVESPIGNTYYNVCVRIHNRSDYPSTGDERLFLNWAKAGINDYWYENWTSYNPLICD